LNVLAQLADSQPRPEGPIEGYMAERHPSMPSLILVWAPCGCLWVGDGQDSFVTPCGAPSADACVFRWNDVVMALQALEAAEKAQKSETKVDDISVSSTAGGVLDGGVAAGGGPPALSAPASTENPETPGGALT